MLEYKKPKGQARITSDASSSGAKAVVKQIKKRFADFQKQERITPERLLGVGCDSEHFVFVRKRSGRLQAESPVSVSKHSVATDLLNLLKRFLMPAKQEIGS